MGAYLNAREVAERLADIRKDFERLLSRPSLVRRPSSRQWAFLRHCFEVVAAGRSEDYPIEKAQALQYKFEVEDKLRRYYLSRGEPVRHVFHLMHQAKAEELGLVGEGYPSANGYVLLVAEDGAQAARPEGRELKEVLERVVTESTDAEWAVYAKLPEVDLTPLDGVFWREGPAYKRIKHLAERHHERGWSIRRPETNPSTKRVLDVKVLKVGEAEAWVRSKEYWYLRWYSIPKGDYAQVDWRETNTQKYGLVYRDGKWLVEQNIYPPPQAQTPHRKRIVVG